MIDYTKELKRLMNDHGSDVPLRAFDDLFAPGSPQHANHRHESKRIDLSQKAGKR